MNDFNDQISRIKKKLSDAKNADKQYNVFGADKHKYNIDKPLTDIELQDFENKIGISLPISFKLFLTKIGNGGTSFAKSATGPFYGIFPVETTTENLLYSDMKFLRERVNIYPKMSDEDWQTLIQKIEDEDLDDNSFEDELGYVYSGLLPIGSQGCTYYHYLVLNGDFAGKVVNIDMDRQKPIWTYENNFLDWYERWLDEVISGQLSAKAPSWFGYTKGGTVESLLRQFESSNEIEEKKDCLIGISNKVSIDTQYITKIEKICSNISNDSPFTNILTEILVKFDYQLSKPHLKKLTETNLLLFVKLIHFHAKQYANEWVEDLKAINSKISDSDTLSYYTFVLEQTKIDYAELLFPFIQNEDENMRATALYSLGKLKNKTDYIEWFILGLKDKSKKVILNTLQALEGVKDLQLLEYYKEIAKNYPDEQDYIQSNLKFRFKDLELWKHNTTNMEKLDFIQPKKKWYEIWN